MYCDSSEYEQWGSQSGQRHPSLIASHRTVGHEVQFLVQWSGPRGETVAWERADSLPIQLTMRYFVKRLEEATVDETVGRHMQENRKLRGQLERVSQYWQKANQRCSILESVVNMFQTEMKNFQQNFFEESARGLGISVMTGGNDASSSSQTNVRSNGHGQQLGIGPGLSARIAHSLIKIKRNLKNLEKSGVLSPQQPQLHHQQSHHISSNQSHLSSSFPTERHPSSRKRRISPSSSSSSSFRSNYNGTNGNNYNNSYAIDKRKLHRRLLSTSNSSNDACLEATTTITKATPTGGGPPPSSGNNLKALIRKLQDHVGGEERGQSEERKGECARVQYTYDPAPPLPHPSHHQYTAEGSSNHNLGPEMGQMQMQHHQHHQHQQQQQQHHHHHHQQHQQQQEKRPYHINGNADTLAVAGATSSSRHQTSSSSFGGEHDSQKMLMMAKPDNRRYSSTSLSLMKEEEKRIVAGDKGGVDLAKSAYGKTEGHVAAVSNGGSSGAQSESNAPRNFFVNGNYHRPLGDHSEAASNSEALRRAREGARHKDGNAEFHPSTSAPLSPTRSKESDSPPLASAASSQPPVVKHELRPHESALDDGVKEMNGKEEYHNVNSSVGGESGNDNKNPAQVTTTPSKILQPPVTGGEGPCVEGTSCPTCGSQFDLKTDLIEHLRTSVECYVAAFKASNDST